jgi:uncharacterized membrane protein SpoIIM required for sporulation
MARDGADLTTSLRSVDLDAYVAAHGREWQRLEDLLGHRRRSGDEVDELIALYQRAATHLSVVRSSAPDPMLVGQLSRLVARARSAVTGTSDPAWRDAARFLSATLPAAIYRARAWWGSAMLSSIALMFGLGAWVAANPDVQHTLLPQDEIDSLVHTDFQTYYSTYAHGSFAAQVWTHNAWIAALCIALGVLGVPVLYLLWQNVANVAIIGGVMVSHGRAGLFFGLILPHGILELTAVFVAAGTGLRLFWSWVSPGARTRSQALAQEGRAAMAIVMGLVGVLAVSGFIEGFVTPSNLPTGVKVAIGVLAEGAFLTYVFVLGSRAVRAGVTGDMLAEEAGDLLPVSG